MWTDQTNRQYIIPQRFEVVEDYVCGLGPVVLGVLDEKVGKPVYSRLVLLGLNAVVLECQGKNIIMWLFKVYMYMYMHVYVHYMLDTDYLLYT